MGSEREDVMFDFPSNPTEGQLFTPLDGPTYRYAAPVWQQVAALYPSLQTAEPRNRIVNGAIQISQENGDSGTIAVGGAGADQWQLSFAAATAMGLFRSPNYVSPNGTPTSLAFNVSTADTAVAAADHLLAYQRIEGLNVGDFEWGTAKARQAILRFAVRAGIAGTYCVAAQNSAASRSWIGAYTIAAGEVGVFVERELIIPGDTSGTWLKDTGVGITLSFVFAAGTTYQGVAGWQAGNRLATASISNGMGAVCQHAITDVGLHLDPDNTGIAPRWEPPNLADQLLRCQRYWRYHTSLIVDTPAASQSIIYPVEFRVAPAISGGGAGFSAAQGYVNSVQLTQTARAYQNIIFNARM
jgi:hypothetical protein